jgi:hypothetical protein
LICQCHLVEAGDYRIGDASVTRCIPSDFAAPGEAAPILDVGMTWSDLWLVVWLVVLIGATFYVLLRMI